MNPNDTPQLILRRSLPCFAKKRNKKPLGQSTPEGPQVDIPLVCMIFAPVTP